MTTTTRSFPHFGPLLLFACLVNMYFYIAGTVRFHPSDARNDRNLELLDTKQLYPVILQHDRPVYGHVHMAKTGGTTVNGILALRYERICGHKGYSYDAFQANERFFQRNGTGAFWENSNLTDIYSKRQKGYSRGRVDPVIMKEIGFENCDWISHEDLSVKQQAYEFWNQFVDWKLPIQLHVPCRDPVDHLLSMCNFKHHVFNCDEMSASTHNSTLLREHLKPCLLAMDRFHSNLENMFDNRIKCYNSQKTNQYISWIGQRLQQRRIVGDYKFRSTNDPRDKTRECLWKFPQLRQAVSSFLIENVDYYNFCDRCIGSSNDIFAEQFT